MIQLTQRQQRLRTRARAIRHDVASALEANVGAETLAMTGNGYATTLGTLHTAIMSMILADTLKGFRGKALKQAIATEIPVSLAAGDLEATLTGWRYILDSHPNSPTDQWAIIAGHDLRFSRFQNSVSGNSRYDWVAIPSIHTSDPEIAFDNEGIPASFIRDRQRQIAAAHGLGEAEAERVRILVARADGMRSLDAKERPVPRTTEIIELAGYVIEGMPMTLYDDVRRPARMLAHDMRASLLLHAPWQRIEEHLGRIAAIGGSLGRCQEREMLEETVAIVRQQTVRHPELDPMLTEAWSATGGISVLTTVRTIDRDTLCARIISKSMHVKEGHVRQFAPTLDWAFNRIAEGRREAQDRLEIGSGSADLQLPYQVDVPLQRALIADGHGLHEAIGMIVSAWSARDDACDKTQIDRLSGIVATSIEPVIPPSAGDQLINRYRIQFERGRISARFDLGSNLRWSRGTLHINGTALPDTIVVAMQNRPACHLSDHPYLADLIVSSVETGKMGLRAHIVDPARPLPPAPA